MKDWEKNSFEPFFVDDTKKKEVTQDNFKFKKYSVSDSIWLAAALLSYEKYKMSKKPTIWDMYLTQSEIKRKAETLTDKKINLARTSEWYCGDSENHTYAYLRKVINGNNKKLRRLSAPDEFGGYRTVPESIDIEDYIFSRNKYIQVKELLDFVNNEYKKLVKKCLYKVNKEDIDCIGILKYLERYAGKEYCGRDKRTDENRQQMEERKKAGKKAFDELKKLKEELLKKEDLKEFKATVSSWLETNGIKLKNFLWIQLKALKYENKPESISIFVENIQKTSRFRVSLEIYNKNAETREMEIYHNHLDLPIKRENGMVYISGSNEKGNIELIDESQEEIRKKVQRGEYEKVQISVIIERTENLTNGEYIERMLKAISDLLPYYEHVVGNLSNKGEESKMSNDSKFDEFDKNIILYGPPGTGKTYSSIIYAVAICDGKSLEEVKNEDYKNVIERYKKLKNEGRIEFTTFHQSYGYEEFIEGIKPIMDDEEDDKDLSYTIEDGVFKKFCEHVKAVNISEKSGIPINSSPTVWKVSLKQTGDNDVRTECMKNGHIRIGWDDYGEDISQEVKYESGGKNILNTFITKMKKGDIVLSCYSASTIDAIGIITGEYEWNDKYSEFKRLRKVDWLAKELNYNILEINNNVPMTLPTVYKLARISADKALEIAGITNKKEKNKKENNNYVFIIDEINRGNISKIFGELITLIEPSKRLGKLEEIQVKLPYTKSEFGVPDNVYILGTMNTADRSIAFMDTALRRRFQFVEMMPDMSELKDIEIEGINVPKMLNTINRRIEILYDKEHTIGHAIFMELKDKPTLEKLSEIFKKSVIPLLKEYFFEDYSKIQLILGKGIVDNQKINMREEFNVIIEGNDLPEEKYTILENNLNSSESYIKIYE